MIPLLGLTDPFPPITHARDDLGGLLAAGADLSPARLLDAYRRGIFPWGRIEGIPVWYNPDPRMVLFPEEFKLRRSLRKTLRNAGMVVRFDTDFPATIAACAEVPRPGQGGTWIDDAMQEAYIRLHDMGWAHSVETWHEDKLIGGLYGLAIGRVFYGESMFSHQRDASKVAFAHLIRFLSERGFGMIDCQMRTDHLTSLGGREIPRRAFLEQLRRLTVQDASPSRWPATPRFDW